MDKPRFKIIKGNTSEVFEQALNNLQDSDYIVRGDVFAFPNKNAGPHQYELIQLFELKETVAKGFGKK